MSAIALATEEAHLASTTAGGAWVSDGGCRDTICSSIHSMEDDYPPRANILFLNAKIQWF